jgi:hypothetical protein
MRPLNWKAEHLVLAGPFSGQVCEAGDGRIRSAEPMRPLKSKEFSSDTYLCGSIVGAGQEVFSRASMIQIHQIG